MRSYLSGILVLLATLQLTNAQFGSLMGWNGPFAPNMGGFGAGWRELAFLGGGLGGGGLGGFGFAPFHFMEFVERPIPCVCAPEDFEDDFMTINDYYYDVCRYDHPEPPVIDAYGNEIYFELPPVYPYRNGRPSGPLRTGIEYNDERRRDDRRDRNGRGRGGHGRDNKHKNDRDENRGDRDREGRGGDREGRGGDRDRDIERRRALLLKK